MLLPSVPLLWQIKGAELDTRINGGLRSQHALWPQQTFLGSSRQYLLRPVYGARHNNIQEKGKHLAVSGGGVETETDRQGCVKTCTLATRFFVLF